MLNSVIFWLLALTLIGMAWWAPVLMEADRAVWRSQSAESAGR